MAVRYAAAVDNLQRLIDDGVKWCWISSHANCSPRCKNYQGKLYSLFQGEVEIGGKKYRERGVIDGISYRPINEALAGPNSDGNGCISGYNCRHRAIEYERGSKAPTDYTEAEIKREYAIDKQQRAFENRIRQMKQEEKQLRACGMEKEAAALRKKWRVLTKEYQIYSIEHDRAYYPYRYVIDRDEEMGLTMLESDVIITSENIKKSFGQKTATLQETISKADQIISKAFESYQTSLKIIDSHFQTTDKQVAHFDSRKIGIFFDINADSAPSDDNRKQFQTYFHETGHNLDFVIGKKIGVGYASGGYKSPTFNATFNQMIVEEGVDFIETYRKMIAQETNQIAVDNADVYRNIFDDFKDNVLSDRRQLSDILDGITNGKMEQLNFGLGGSHTRRDKDYWKKHSVGVEAFAHFTSALITNPKSAEMLINIFSKSYQIYKEILSL